jgi:hypothetical protein
VTMMSENADMTVLQQALNTTSLHEALSRPGDAPPERPAPAPVVEDIIRMDCPGCGAAYVGPRPTRTSARSFCASCDYPLFLSVAPQPPAAAETDLGKRRLPGVDGKDRLGAIPCPSCAEPNMPDPHGQCIRCGAVLFPEPLPEPEPEALPEVDAIVVYRSNYWWIIATATLSVLLAATAGALYWTW